MTVPVLWAVFVFFMHSIPGNDLVYQDPWRILKFDKLTHMGIFAFQVMTLIVAFRKQNRFRWLNLHARKMSVLLALLYGGVLEFVQGQFFTDRTSDPMDFLANTLGSLLGIVAFRVVYGRELARA